MQLSLSLFLAIGAIAALVFVLLKIRKNQIKTADAVFWFLFAACFVVLAVFPQLAFRCAGLLGIESPANFIFLCVLAILFIKVLLQSMEIAKLKAKLSELVQDLALRDDGE